MNFWILTNEYPPFFGGGIATYGEAMAREYVRAGHTVTVFTQDDRRSFIEYPQSRLRIVRFFSEDANQFTPYALAKAYQAAQIVLQYLEKERPDSIEVQECTGLGYYLFLEKQAGNPLLRQIPLMVLAHTPLYLVRENNHDSLLSKDYLLYKEMESFCLQQADQVVVPSLFLKNVLSQEFSRDFLHIPLPLPVFRCKHVVSFAIRNKLPTGVFVGRLEYRKGIQLLIEQSVALWQKGFFFRLQIIGNDQFYAPFNDFLGKKMQQMYGEWVNRGYLLFINAQNPAHVHKAMRQADFVIVPSFFENFPYVCMEAMLLGKPVIASRSGGQAEMVGEDGRCGLLFDALVPWTLGVVLKKMCGLGSYRRWIMGRRAKKRIKELCRASTIVTRRITAVKTYCPPMPPCVLPQPLTIVYTSVPCFQELSVRIKELIAEPFSKEIIFSIAEQGASPERQMLETCAEQQFIKLLVSPQGTPVRELRRRAAAEACMPGICFCSADVILFPDALSCFAKTLQQYDFAYSPALILDNVHMTTLFTVDTILLKMVNPAVVAYRTAAFLQYGCSTVDVNVSGFEEYCSIFELIMHGCRGMLTGSSPLYTTALSPYFSAAVFVAHRYYLQAMQNYLKPQQLIQVLENIL